MYQGGKNNSAFIHNKAANNMNVAQTMSERKAVQNSVLSGGSNKFEKLGYQNFDKIGDLRNLGSLQNSVNN